jgi:hypothetical protein
MADITALQPAATVADAQRGAAGRRYWGAWSPDDCGAIG